MHAHLKPRAILFDFYGTLVDIKTDEHDARPWEVLAGFLRYRGSRLDGEALQHAYFQRVRDILDGSSEQHPDVDVAAIFEDVLRICGVANANTLAITVAQLFRSLTVKRFGLFDETLEVLEALSQRFRLGLVSDSQEAYFFPELRLTGLEPMFPTIVVSSPHGFRKPDPRLFRFALDKLELRGEDVVYAGDSWERDVVGATDAGLHAVWVRREDEETALPEERDVLVMRDLRGLLELTPP